LLDANVPLIEAAKNVVPVAVTAAASVGFSSITGKLRSNPPSLRKKVVL
jgi:hypothetical protein